MKKLNVKWVLIACVLGAILYASIFLFGAHSDSFKFVESAMKSSYEVRERVGNVQKVSLDPSGEYREKFFNMKKWAVMTVDIVGDKGRITANVSVTNVSGSWNLDEITVHGETIYRNSQTK